MNRKGFTLIELLATITLLGIILITTTNIILNVIDNSKKKTYNNQINRIESAAKIWAVKNTEKLPTLGQVYEVSFADLVKSGVLSNEEIVNPLNKKILKGCVYVTNQSDDYNYKYNENCSIQTFLVNYNLNGGTLDKENASFYDVTTETFILNNPSKNDYIFVGWTGSNGRIPQKTVSITKGSTGNKEYTANWETIEYAISYNLNGGTATNPVKYDVETNAFTLNNPNRIGYIFIGWTGANGTVPELSVTISSGSAGDRLYIANWFKSEYTITYNLNGGTATNPVKYNFEDNAFTLNNPNRTGYVFKGWTGANGTVPELSVTISSGSAGNRLYIANWMAIEYAISYNFNGGNISNNYTSYNAETATFTLNNPTKNNQIFIGWIGSNGTEPQTSVSVNKGSMGN
ncbi:MAG: InlB B-repeat-containing protein, partial [Bacilli bacterium]